MKKHPLPHLLTNVACTQQDNFKQVNGVQWYSLDEVREMMADGTINNGSTLAALGIFFARL